MTSPCGSVVGILTLIELEMSQISLLQIGQEDIMVQRQVKEGLVVEASEDFTVALDTILKEDLKVEGVVRELVNRIQTRRKELDLDVTDSIELSVKTESTLVRQALETRKDYISGETLAVSLAEVSEIQDAWEVELNGEQAELSLVKKA